MFAAAICGGFGFFCIQDVKLNSLLCEEFGCFFAGKFVWFLVTPLCAYLIYKYFDISHTEAENERESYYERTN